jgi:hypothetical protein
LLAVATDEKIVLWRLDNATEFASFALAGGEAYQGSGEEILAFAAVAE